MEVSVRILGHVIVEYDVDPLNVHPSAEEVGGHQNPPLEILELLIAGQPVEEERREIINTAATVQPPHLPLKAMMC